MKTTNNKWPQVLDDTSTDHDFPDDKFKVSCMQEIENVMLVIYRMIKLCIMGVNVVLTIGSLCSLSCEEYNSST